MNTIIIIRKIFKPILLFVLITLVKIGVGQVISSDPALPSDTNAVKIIYDASLGNSSLSDYSGDIYAHTGVLTNLSNSNSEWRYVIAEWTENNDKVKLTPLGNDKWELNIGPSIREFYAVPNSETIESIAFVFRNEDGSLVGKTEANDDIFLDVNNASLAVSIAMPDVQPYFTDSNTSFNLSIQSFGAQKVNILHDNEMVLTVSDSVESFSYTIEPKDVGAHYLVAEAVGTNDTIYSKFIYVVRSDLQAIQLPAELKDGINYINDSTVTLVLHAPYKQSVYAYGSFNNWEPLAMNRTSNDINNIDLRYWITLKGLLKQDEYIFQYIVDEKLRIADPYTEKVIDPNHDKFLDEETYPNRPEMPVQIGNNLASVIQIEKPKYEWQITNFEAPKAEDLVIYELLIRDFAEQGNYQTLIDTIGYFKRLGINAIELMPTNEFEGNESWGYNPSFYFACDKAYGTKNKFKEFIDVCHKNGIAVIIDQVLNHSFSQSPFLQLYFDANAGDWGQPTSESPWYNETSPNTSFSWGYDFNHESPYTKALVDSVNAYWLSEFNVDGIRFDFTKGFTNTIGDGQAYDEARIAILKRMNTEILKRNPKAYVIFEHIADNNEEKELADEGILLWGKMFDKYSEGIMGYNEGNKSDLSWGSYKNRGWNKPHLVSYMESHDEERLLFKCLEYGNSNTDYNTKELNTALARAEMAASFFFTIPGPKMIWQFGEYGYDISIDEGGRTSNKPIKWDYLENEKRQRLFSVYSALIKLKIEHDIFETTNYNLDVSGLVKRISLISDDLHVNILGNFDIEEQSFNPEFSKTGTWYDYFTGESIEIDDVNANISLKAGEYHIYTSELLETPNIVTSLNQANKLASSEISLSTYPNPATDVFNIELNLKSDLNNASLAIYSLKGSKIRELQLNSMKTGVQNITLNLNNFNGSNLEPGAYIIKLSSDNQFASSLLIIK